MVVAVWTSGLRRLQSLMPRCHREGKEFTPGPWVRHVDRHQDFEPARDLWVDSAVSGQPAPKRIAMFPCPSSQFPFGPAKRQQA